MSQNSFIHDGNHVPIESYKSLTSGVQTVVTSGTPVQLLSSTTSCKRIDIVAQSGNSGIVYVGGSNTLASTQTGIPLAPLGSYTFYVTDVSIVYVDSTANGDKISFEYFN
jgi:hypothetical protein